MSDRFNVGQTKDLLASSTSLDANLILMARLDHVITNAVHLQQMALGNLPQRFKEKVLATMAVSVKAKLNAVLLASGNMSQVDVAKLKVVLRRIK